tara:strand:- start:2353 stop:6099 length:3747 start_codon:yes stop_codon:yes gene_type:complete
MAKFEDIYGKDIYTGSGSVSLFNCWTENVDKHDTSSFYNWEQDNEPLYDLEERTYLNWEKLGFPTSCVPGIALVVSADGHSATGVDGCNRSVFLDLSSCMNALPKFIDFPVLIEVANYGSLGSLNIQDISIGGRGSLEIINRNSYRGLSYVVSGDGAVGFEGIGTNAALHPYNRGISYKTTRGGADTNGNDKYHYFGAVTGIDNDYAGIGGIGEVKSWTLKNQIVGASALSISSTVVSALTEPRFEGQTNVFIAGAGRLNGNWGMTVGVKGVKPVITGSPNGVQRVDVVPYEETTDGLAESRLYDASSYGNFIGTTDELSKLSAEHFSTNSMVYGNYLDSITVANVGGPLYIRGFLVNGARAVQDGVTIINSNAVLEGCASILNNGNGFLISNSDVTLTRGTIAYRNYLKNGTSRLDGNWADLAIKDSIFKDDSAGLKAINSNVTLSSTSAFEFSIRDSASAILPINDMYQFARNTNGVCLINSVFKGGLEETASIATWGNTQKYNTKTYFHVDNNTHNGILAKESTINLMGRLELFNNLRGMDLEGTITTLDEFGIQGNQRQGIRAYNSDIKYNASFQDSDVDLPLAMSQLHFSGNGSHIELDNSTFKPTKGISMDSNYGLMKFIKPHGINNVAGAEYVNIIPSINISNNSTAELVHPWITRTGSEAIDELPAYGSLVSVDNGSNVIFRGTQNYATRMVGPNTHEKQRFTAGVYGNNNSNIEFTGPTVIAQFGVDVLADNNSIMSFNPPRDLQKGGCDVSSYTLSDEANHTMVELHSTRACLVADNGSIINMEHLGDYQRQWNRFGAGYTNGQAALLSGTDFSVSTASNKVSYNFETFVSAGSMQFYPNPNDAADYDSVPAKGNEAVNPFNSVTPAYAFSKNGDALDGISDKYYGYLDGGDGKAWDGAAWATAQDGASGLTGGGVCVRAVHGSEVKVNNVHFPAGWWNPSNAWFDSGDSTSVPAGAGGGLCDRLFIWNIADSSKLFASYTSVSAVFPSDAGYFGPSSVWEAKGTNDKNAALNVAYGAPSSTPDTSCLSVLDYFGTGPAGNILPTPSGGALSHWFGPQSSQNQGPFRLYLSPDPVVNRMVGGNVHPNADHQFGLANQLYSQGYQPSGDMMVSGDVSSLYANVVKWRPTMADIMLHDLAYQHHIAANDPATIGNLTTSGFYYASEMLEGGGSPRIFLDESAANTFANAKHLAVGKSGLARMVSIYGPYTCPEGDSSINASKQYGRGYKSSSQFNLGKEN